MKRGLKSTRRVSTDVKILNNGANVRRNGQRRKNVPLQSWDQRGMRMLGEQRGKLGRKILLHPLKGD